jgi:hypothetical protein
MKMKIIQISLTVTLNIKAHKSKSFFPNIKEKNGFAHFFKKLNIRKSN